MLKQIGYDDAKIEKLIRLIGNESFFNKYVDGLQLESDVKPEMISRKKAA